MLPLLLLVALGIGHLSAKSPQDPPSREVGINQTILKGNIGVLWGREVLIWEMAEKYQLDYDFHKKILNCECNLRRDPDTCRGDSGMAYGPAQFWESTFNAYCKGEYKNEKDQIECYGQMMRAGEGHQWGCYNNLIKTYADK